MAPETGSISIQNGGYRIMNQKELSRWLRAIVIVCWVLCAVMGALFMPFAFRTLAAENPEAAWLTWPRLIIFWIALIPVIVALWQGWQIFGEIGRDNSFCPENARRLKIISYLAAGDTVLVVIYAVILAMAHSLFLPVILLHLVVIFVGIAVAVAAAALSHLTHKAAVLQDENELTI